MLDVTGNDAIVDWIFLELRYKGDPSMVLAARPALLQRDGDVVDVDGVSPVRIPVLPADDYYIVLKHRNHLGILSADPVSFAAATTTYDFTADAANTSGATNGIAALSDGAFGLFSGDFDRNGQVQNSDIFTMVTSIGLAGYQAGDFDLNGQVQNTDLQLHLVPNYACGIGKCFQE
ncbi:MAG: hypothetical protein H6558_08450 [Lewinellaceae bacterium]|nr:hypothetical protein [Lewinellaceae bacterium]